MTPAEMQAALASVSAAVMPVKAHERKPIPAGIAAKIEVRAARVAAAAKSKPALSAPVRAGAEGVAAPAKGATLRAQSAAAPPPRPDISTIRKARLVGNVIQLQLTPTPATVKAIREKKVPPAATMALAAATKVANGLAVEIMAGKKIVASAPAQDSGPATPLAAAPVVAAPAARVGGG